VRIRRQDTSQKTAGLSAIYSGKINGNRIEGDVAYSWPGHPDFPPSAKWHAVFNTGSAYSGKHDVSGIWHALLPEPNKGIVWRTKIEQNADKIKIIWAENHTPADGKAAFEGRFISDTAIEGTIFWPDSTAQRPNTSFGRLAIDGDRLLTNTGGVFERGIGPPSVQRHGPTTEQALLFGVLMLGRLTGRRPGLPGRIQSALNDAGDYDAACKSDSRKVADCSAARSARSDAGALWVQLDQEIEELQGAEKKLKPLCDAGQKDACQKLQAVRADLDNDVSFRSERVR